MEVLRTEHKPEVLEVSDIRKILGCGLNQAYKLVNSGEFRVIRLGRKIVVPRDSFYKWFNGQEQEQ